MPTKPPSLRPAHLTPSQDRRRLHDAHRGSSSARGYGRDWQKLRARVLAEEPLCRRCLVEGKVTPATVADHIETIAARPDLRLERSNIQPLCVPCHSVVTIEFDGGFGQRRTQKVPSPPEAPGSTE